MAPAEASAAPVSGVKAMAMTSAARPESKALVATCVILMSQYDGRRERPGANSLGGDLG
jgi:hypothetical protein